MMNMPFIALASMIMTVMHAVPAAAADKADGAHPGNGDAVRVTAIVSPAAGGDAELEVRVTVADGHQIAFNYGGIVQVFGVYVLGPRGWAATNQPKLNWMHQQVTQGQPVTITPDRPWTVRFHLSEYFDVRALTKGKATAVQVNVKFFSEEAKMKEPMDSGAIVFTARAAQ